MEKPVASEVIPPTPETLVPEKVTEVRASQAEVEKGQAEPNEAFFGSLLLFCLALSLLSATGYFGFVGYRYFRQVQTEKAIPSLETLPKATVVEPAPETVSAVTENTETQSETSVAPTTIDKKTLALKVLNGGTAKGVAGTYAEKLKTAGFTKTVVGNAFGDYTGQTLYYAKGQSAGADMLKLEIVKTYPAIMVQEAPSNNKDATAATYVLILGR